MARKPRDIGASGATNVQRQRDVNEDFGQLLKRLDNIAGSISRMTGGPPEPAATGGGTIRSILPNAPDLMAEPGDQQSGRGRGLWPRREP